jgi:hypothetical protein
MSEISITRPCVYAGVNHVSGLTDGAINAMVSVLSSQKSNQEVNYERYFNEAVT